MRPGRAREGLVGWSFALPFVVFFTVFMAGPILAALVTSFTDLRVTDIRSPFSVDIVGVDNYVAVLQDPIFHRAAVNTAIFVLVGIPLTMVLGLLTAVGLNSAIVKFRTLFRVGYYMPVVTSIAAVAVVWRMVLGAEIGLVNGILSVFGITGPGWLTSSSLALGSLIVMAAWRNMGFLMIIFLAGLQTIPRDLYEAAEVDGSSRWQQFRHVTLPLLRPTMLFAAVITGIGYLQFFEEPFVMTQGGPLNSTLSVAYHAYNQFSFGNYGYTAAASYVLFLAIALLTVFWFRLFRPQT
ncbi:sugar ABC transporter permease [Phytoactinopolyspora alkaliphila]|uniref:Sugar ABC transporter permease n=2 Tax=Phytoactinopolyspora alkaliphila TaxID=1783498 RepID=A0A6N9YRP9_9ACTN|nr:sugar ABC transporter permease [Phytoactinopolyspora alkaliphila]